MYQPAMVSMSIRDVYASLTATPPDPTDSAYPAADKSVVLMINRTVV
jgi:hypothetical protein